MAPDVADELLPLVSMGGGGGGPIDCRSCVTVVAALCAAVISPDWTADSKDVKSVMN